MKKFGLAYLMLPGYRAIFAMLALFIAALLIDALDSFGIEERSDDAFESSVDRVLSVFYGGNDRVGQEEITLIVIDQASLDYFHADGLTSHRSWPPDYELFADLVMIARDYKPRAIFMDFYYGFPRDEPAVIADFAATLLSDPDIPVLIGPVSDDPALAPLKAVKQTSLQAQDVDIYPLSDGSGLPRPAVALYNIICEQSPTPGCHNLPANFMEKELAINWGFGMSDRMARITPEHMLESCRGGNIWQRIKTSSSLFWFNMNRSLNTQKLDKRECFYFDTIPAAWLFAPPEGIELDEFLNGRTILIGSDLEWLADRFESPLLGVLPGVTWHAMALDNLLEGKSAVRVPPGKVFLGIDALDLLEVILTLVALALAISSIRHADNSWFSARRRLAVIIVLCAIASIFTLIFTSWPAANALAVILMATGLLWIGKSDSKTTELEMERTEQGDISDET